MHIDRLDHLVLTVADIDATVDFYTRILGMRAVTFGPGRTGLAFGHSKINLHQAGREFEPKAHRPTPGSADLCLIAADPLEQVIEELTAHDVPHRGGPGRAYRRNRHHPQRLLPRPRPEPDRGQQLRITPACGRRGQGCCDRRPIREGHAIGCACKVCPSAASPGMRTRRTGRIAPSDWRLIVRRLRQ